MAIKFITGTEINAELEKLIDKAENDIVLICPYFKLHDKLKKELNAKKGEPELKITIVFGKNPQDLHKSLSKEDFDFLKEFPNIEIRYEAALHAKYYANDTKAIISSMNLYDASQDKNIEAGLLMDVENLISEISNKLLKKGEPEVEAFHYFNKVINNADIMYHKSPEFKKGFFSNEYLKSEIQVNKMEDLYSSALKPKTVGYKSFEETKESTGYCIRTGVSIPFNLEKPYTDKAFRTWQNFSNPDYEESYCHCTGEVSNGETSFKTPILRKNWKVAKSKFNF